VRKAPQTDIAALRRSVIQRGHLRVSVDSGGHSRRAAHNVDFDWWGFRRVGRLAPATHCLPRTIDRNAQIHCVCVHPDVYK
jgi:hypothetical protein